MIRMNDAEAAAYVLRQREVMANGERALHGIACPTCYRLLPLEQVVSGEWADALEGKRCQCGGIATAQEIDDALGMSVQFFEHRKFRLTE